jgi:hypothetical protein
MSSNVSRDTFVQGPPATKRKRRREKQVQHSSEQGCAHTCRKEGRDSSAGHCKWNKQVLMTHQ